MMRKMLAVVVPLLGVGLTLASEFLLLRMTVETELLEEPLRRNLAILGTLVAGVVLLVGSVYVTTRITVLLITPPPPTHLRPDVTLGIPRAVTPAVSPGVASGISSDDPRASS